jgi:hypothetical protein
MTPADFSTNANAWIDAVFSVANHMLTLVVAVLGSAAYLQLRSRSKGHENDIAKHDDDIVAIKATLAGNGTPVVSTKQPTDAPPSTPVPQTIPTPTTVVTPASTAYTTE